jgi:hypothetical protein
MFLESTFQQVNAAGLRLMTGSSCENKIFSSGFRAVGYITREQLAEIKTSAYGT